MMKELVFLVVATFHATTLDSKYLLVELEDASDELVLPPRPPVISPGPDEPNDSDELVLPPRPPVISPGPDEPNEFLAATNEHGKNDVNRFNS